MTQLRTDYTIVAQYGYVRGQLGERIDPDPYHLMGEWLEREYTTDKLIVRTHDERAPQQIHRNKARRDSHIQQVASATQRTDPERQASDLSTGVSDAEGHLPTKEVDSLNESVQATVTTPVSELEASETPNEVCPSRKTTRRQYDGERDTRASVHTQDKTHDPTQTVDDDPIQYITLRMKGQ